MISGNNITDNRDWGIYFETSNNIITDNNIAGSKYGVYLSAIFAAQNNTFYQNNFMNNTVQVYTGSAGNVQVWDNGYPSGGNYWSSYAGIDEKNGSNQNIAGPDGIGDTPVIIDLNNTDRYPIMTPSTLNASFQAHSPTPPNSTQVLWHFDVIEPNYVTPDAFEQNPAVLPYLDGSISSTHVPELVAGKIGNALSFKGPEYIWAQESPTLEISGELTIDTWICVKDYQNETYNNVVVNSVRTLEKYGPRVYGLSVNGLSSENAASEPLGALFGYIYTETEGYNEIVTVDSVVSLNQWTHVVFTRSLTTGMHIYVDGQEKAVKVTAGEQNPKGPIKTGTDFYIGPDYIGNIDEVYLSNVAINPKSSPQLTYWWFLIVVTFGIAILLGTLYFSRKRRIKSAFF